MIGRLNSLEQFVFYLQQAPGVGSATLRKIIGRIKADNQILDDILNLDETALRLKCGLKAEVISAIAYPSSRTVSLWNSIVDKGVIIRIVGFDGYPTRLSSILRNTAPPVLYLLGNEKLLTSHSVGFCGSRKASIKGIEVAESLGEILVKKSIVVVSGYAAGVDMATHVGAIRAGGATIIVLPSGISHFHLKEPISGLFADNDLTRVLVISEFSPGIPWKAHNAMTRNRTIVGLSDAMVVIESGPEGGTFEAGKTALTLGIPLFCIEYAIPPTSATGNTFFLKNGATALRRTSSGLPNVKEILATVENSDIMHEVNEHQSQFSFS